MPTRLQPTPPPVHPSSPSHLQSPMASSHNSPPFHWHLAELNDKDFQVHGRSILLVVAAFTVLFVLSLLYLYARWVLLYRLRLRHNGREPKPQPIAGLDEVTIKSFPVKLHRAGAGGSQESECSICLAVFAEMEMVKVMPVCSHAFHLECIDVWLSAHRSCPLLPGRPRRIDGRDRLNVCELACEQSI